MNSKNLIVALGKFDGLHRGHQKLIFRAVEIASALGGDAIVYAIGTPIKNVITDNKEKEDMLKSLGITQVIFRSLDEGLKNMHPGEFVKKILVEELGVTSVVVGENFRFGKDRCASSTDLKELCAKCGIDTQIIDTVYTTSIEGAKEPINSTAIRKYVQDGYVDYAANYLGRLYSIKGKVVEGKHLGRKLGFPTINIVPKADCLVPKHGVYATRVKILGNTYDAITNVGTNPTVENGDIIKIETHIFDADVDCYGSTAEVHFVSFVRDEMRFSDVDDLAHQMEKDQKIARDILIKNRGTV